jgi:hypothetical protein
MGMVEKSRKDRVETALRKNLGLRMLVSIVNPKAYEMNLKAIADVLADDVLRALKSDLK